MSSTSAYIHTHVIISSYYSMMNPVFITKALCTCAFVIRLYIDLSYHVCLYSFITSPWPYLFWIRSHLTDTSDRTFIVLFVNRACCFVYSFFTKILNQISFCFEKKASQHDTIYGKLLQRKKLWYPWF